MSGLLDFPDGFDEDYVPAPLEFNLARARSMLERLYGVDLERIPEAGEGECADCKRQAVLLQYSATLRVCRRCALSRRRAA